MARWRARLIWGALCIYCLLVWTPTVAQGQPVVRGTRCRKFARQADASAVRAICRRQDPCGGPRFTFPSSFLYSTACRLGLDKNCEPLPDGIDTCVQWLHVINPEPMPCPDLCTQHAPALQSPHKQVTQQPQQQAAPAARLSPATIARSLRSQQAVAQHLAEHDFEYGLLETGAQYTASFEQPVLLGDEQHERALLQQQALPTPPIKPQVVVLTASNAIPLEQATSLLPPLDQMTPMQVQVITADEALAEVASYNLSDSSIPADANTASPSPSPGAAAATTEVVIQFPPMWMPVEGKNTAWVLPVVCTYWALIGMVIGYLAWVKRHDPLVYIKLQQPISTADPSQDAQQQVDTQQVTEKGGKGDHGNESEIMVDNPLAERGSVTLMEVTPLSGKADLGRSSSDEPNNLIGEQLRAMDVDGAGVVTVPEGQQAGTQPYAAGTHPRASITRGDGAVGGYMFAEGMPQEPAGAMVPVASLRQRVRRSGTGAAGEDLEQGRVIASSSFAPWPRISNPTIPAVAPEPTQAGPHAMGPPPPAADSEEHSFFGNLFRSFTKTKSGKQTGEDAVGRKSTAGHGVVVVEPTSGATGDQTHRSLASKLSRSFKVVPITDDEQHKQQSREGDASADAANSSRGDMGLAVSSSRSARFASAPSAAHDAPVHSSFRVRNIHAGSAGAAPARVTFTGMAAQLNVTGIEGEEDLMAAATQLPVLSPRLMSPRSMQVRAKPPAEDLLLQADDSLRQQADPPGAVAMETQQQEQTSSQQPAAIAKVQATRMVTAMRVQSPLHVDQPQSTTAPDAAKARTAVPHPQTAPATTRNVAAATTTAAAAATARAEAAPTTPDVRLQVDPLPQHVPAPPNVPSGAAGLRPSSRPLTFVGAKGTAAAPPTAAPREQATLVGDESAVSRGGRSISNPATETSQQGAVEAGRRRVGSTPAAPPPAPAPPVQQPSKDPSKQAW